ncbi:glyoxalase [Streptomyces sp. NBC_01498]|uniref:VOC family protein n=1 Tax=Streptomyces sp. NBC_01498 TaxID=2975870 RepID=UPI002E7BECFB|nr:VOC family protein [Streptomyces sp. NBC_01498]WTL23923.1 glyoxalase [Streptomyces sp. NBC_01498]
MGLPVVHFEIVGTDPAGLRAFYGALFGWEFDVGDASTPAVSAPGEYGFVHGTANPVPDAPAVGSGAPGINGGVAGGPDLRPRVLFYIGVPDVEAALRKAESLGGTRRMGPEPKDAEPGALLVGHFADPEGNVVGVAGTA